MFPIQQLVEGLDLLVPSDSCLPIILCSPLAPMDLVVQRNLLVPKVVAGHQVTDFTCIETLKIQSARL